MRLQTVGGATRWALRPADDLLNARQQDGLARAVHVEWGLQLDEARLLHRIATGRVPVSEWAQHAGNNVDGLDIPIYANKLAAETGLPAVEPAPALYRLLLDHGRAAAGAAAPSSYRARKLCAWLPEDVRAAAAALLTRGERLAQEAVGTELLRGNASVLRTPGRYSEST